MIMIIYIYVFEVGNVLIPSFKSPPIAHLLYFTSSVRFANYSEQENDTLICLESENCCQVRGLVPVL